MPSRLWCSSSSSFSLWLLLLLLSPTPLPHQCKHTSAHILSGKKCCRKSNTQKEHLRTCTTVHPTDSKQTDYQQNKPNFSRPHCQVVVFSPFVYNIWFLCNGRFQQQMATYTSLNVCGEIHKESLSLKVKVQV